MDHIPAGADRLVVALSDIEMGAGGVLDDFPHPAWLADWIARYSAPPYDRLAVDLVLNGDTFDLLKVAVDGKHPRHVTAAVALAKLRQIIAAHRPFFVGLRTFLMGARAPRRVFFVVGNHDAELVFPEVQRAIEAEIDAPGVEFPGFRIDIGDVRLEHGNQHDTMFRVDEAQPLTPYEGEPILDLPWGTVAIVDAMLPLQPLFFALDRVRPRPVVFQVLPEFQEVLSHAFWRYWTRDYLMDFMSRRADPTRKVSWTLLKEVAYRFSTFDPSTSMDEGYHQLLRDHDDFRLVIIGHHHRPAWWSYGDRRLLQLGCLRDEFMIDRTGQVIGAIPKVYAEAYMRDGRVIRSALLEREGPPSPVGHVPATISSLRPRLVESLGSTSERLRQAADEQAQLIAEAEAGAQNMGGPPGGSRPLSD